MTLTAVTRDCGVSHQTTRNVLLRAGVPTERRVGKQWREHLDEIVRLYLDQGRPMREIARLVNLGGESVSEALLFAGVEVKRGGWRTIAFPKLRELAVGESLDLPSVGGTKRNKYARYYFMAKKAGIKVSVNVISDEKVRVTRKA